MLKFKAVAFTFWLNLCPCSTEMRCNQDPNMTVNACCHDCTWSKGRPNQSKVLQKTCFSKAVKNRCNVLCCTGHQSRYLNGFPFPLPIFLQFCIRMQLSTWFPFFYLTSANLCCSTLGNQTLFVCMKNTCRTITNQALS